LFIQNLSLTNDLVVMLTSSNTAPTSVSATTGIFLPKGYSGYVADGLFVPNSYVWIACVQSGASPYLILSA
jgi:hypothetical protein